MASVALAHRTGVSIAPGTDFGGGSTRANQLAWEVQQLVAAGLAPWQALGSATWRGGELLGEPDAGAIREGGPADFVLVQRRFALGSVCAVARVARLLGGRPARSPIPSGTPQPSTRRTMDNVIAKLPVPILRDPAFARLWFIQASTQVGGNMALYALTILVFATTRSNTAVSALVMSFLIPAILLSAAAGVLVDRLDVRWAMIVPNTVRTLLTLGLALAGANVAVLLVLNLGVSLTSVVLTPAEASMIPRIVPKPQLEVAMGVFNLTLQASFAVGFAFLGPLLVAIAGPSATLVVVTGFYVGATIATLGLPSAPPVAIEPGRAGRAIREPIRQLREGFAAIGGNREVGRPLLHLAASASLVGVLGVLGPNLAVSLGLDPKDLIVIVLPLGLGVVAGVGGLRWLGGGLSRRRAAETGLITLGLLAAGISAAGPLGRTVGLPVIEPVVVLAFFAGAAYAVTSVSAQTALFENMPAAIRGRIFGVLASIVSATSLVSVLIAGPLGDAISAPAVIAITAGGVVVLAVWSAIVFGRRPRTDRTDPAG